jgi:hypothetical protein
LFSIKYLHEAYGHPYPANNFGLDTTMQGLKRRLAKTPFYVMPISPRILLSLYSHLDMDKPSDLALWCSFLLAFFGLFRKGNVVPDTGPIDPRQTLTRGHIMLDRENKIVYVHVTFSFVKGTWSFPFHLTPTQLLTCTDIWRSCSTLSKHQVLHQRSATRLPVLSPIETSLSASRLYCPSLACPLTSIVDTVSAGEDAHTCIRWEVPSFKSKLLETGAANASQDISIFQQKNV